MRKEKRKSGAHVGIEADCVGGEGADDHALIVKAEETAEHLARDSAEKAHIADAVEQCVSAKQ